MRAVLRVVLRLLWVVRLIVPPHVILLCGNRDGRIVHALLVVLRSVIHVSSASNVLLWCDGDRPLRKRVGSLRLLRWVLHGRCDLVRRRCGSPLQVP